MSTDDDQRETGDDQTAEQGPVCGERLAAARREQEVPLTDVAKELHLDEFKVRALEANDFDALGAPVFAKGHLRKYAQIVGLAEADILDDYEALNRSAGAPPLISTRSRPRREIAPGPWIALVAVLGLVAVAYWWFAVRMPAETTIEPESPAPAEALPVEEPVDEADGDDAAPTETEDVSASEPPIDTSVTEPPGEPPVTAVDPNRLEVVLSYSGDCWTEITDAGGRRLFFELGRAGRNVNLSGEAPFNVLFGNAGNVSLEVNGRAFEIPAESRRGRTARLTIRGGDSGS